MAAGLSLRSTIYDPAEGDFAGRFIASNAKTTTVTSLDAVSTDTDEINVSYTSLYGFSALAKFFDITIDYADYIFMPSSYRGGITPPATANVIAHIRNVLDTQITSTTNA